MHTLLACYMAICRSMQQRNHVCYITKELSIPWNISCLPNKCRLFLNLSAICSVYVSLSLHLLSTACFSFEPYTSERRLLRAHSEYGVRSNSISPDRHKALLALLPTFLLAALLSIAARLVAMSPIQAHPMHTLGSHCFAALLNKHIFDQTTHIWNLNRNQFCHMQICSSILNMKAHSTRVHTHTRARAQSGWH